MTEGGDIVVDPIEPGEDDVKIYRLNTRMPRQDAVVSVMIGGAGSHAGICYRLNDEGERRHLHLAGHLRLKNEPSPSDMLWVEPALDESALADVCTFARLIARKYAKGDVPYAFSSEGVTLTEEGVLRLNGKSGVTCAVFLILVFRHSGINLVDIASWNDRSIARQQEDRTAYELLLACLEQRHPEQAKLIKGEVDCVRIRPEEVAAASGIWGHPINFTRAEKIGRRVLGVIQDSARPSP